VTAADALAFLRAFAAIPIVWAIAVDDTPVAFALFALAALSDAIDGRLARRAGTLGPRGAFLDPLADKILVLATLIALALAGLVNAWLVGLIATREVTVLGLRARAYARGQRLPADTAAKAKTVLEMLGALLLIGTPAPFSSLGAVLLLGGLIVGLVTLPRYLPGRVRRLA
jgi:CDP-diacylglycerol--glycerol-3-phosphate 3-phosphatidyltransferase